jgi:hypothetical protein
MVGDESGLMYAEVVDLRPINCCDDVENVLPTSRFVDMLMEI